MSTRPAPGRPVPVSTYRVQLHGPTDVSPGFTFDDAAQVVPYLADLGVTHLYCSPWLQAAKGSTHGYDVVDHSRVNDELGGPEGLERLVAACREHGLGIVLDVVPNHAGIAAPESQNPAWWSVLRDGQASPYASWFDVDWSTGPVIPVLGAPLGECVPDLELLEDRIRYHEHEVPLAPGTRVEGDVLATLERQHYRLAFWRTAEEELGYRRFFDVTTLAALRVEDPEVFAATHRVVLEQVRDGVVDGLRIDHPDGLADPRAYLHRLAECTGGTWVVVEKILEPEEDLPGSWETAGTTGYDALNRITQVLADPEGAEPLTRLWHELSGSDAPYDEIAREARRQVLDQVLAAEVERLVELAQRVCAQDPLLVDTTGRGLREALVELLACFPVYRAYVPPAGPAAEVARGYVGLAVAEAVEGVPHRERELGVWRTLVLAEGPSGPEAEELVVRFQQTCGPAVAKGVEDTTFYRYLRLTALNEVGGDPAQLGLPVNDFHAQWERVAELVPLGMTTLSTHDTKRAEDVRARLLLLTECPDEWAAAARSWSAMAGPYRSAAGPDHVAEHLLWQSWVGAWPLPVERALPYVEKAVREAKLRTSWVDPDEDYDEAVAAFVRGVLADPALCEAVGAFVARLEPAWHVACLAQKALQLTLPGVADTYQGSELWALSLVDPDNRRPVDFAERRRLLASLDGSAPPLDGSGQAKLHVVASALRLRRERPGVFLEGGYRPLEAAARAVGYLRGHDVAVVAPIRPLAVVEHGWGEDCVELPDGTWVDRFTGGEWTGGPVRLAQLLDEFPVALLVRR